jgi:hypothetical protein
MEWRRRAKKDGTTARDMKRESLDVIKREDDMLRGRGNAVQYQGMGSLSEEIR